MGGKGPRGLSYAIISASLFGVLLSVTFYSICSKACIRLFALSANTTKLFTSNS